MSEENVEAVRWGYNAWNRRDFDRILELADPEIVPCKAVVSAQLVTAPSEALETDAAYLAITPRA
jgi:hypothetical protein